MKRVNLYGIAAALLIVFAAGHSFGALIHTKSFGAQADAVATAMSTVRFACTREDCSWQQFYLGFGWFCTVFMLFSAYVAWYIGSRHPEEQSTLAPLAVALSLSYAAGALISWAFLFPLPAIFSLAVALLLTGAVMNSGALVRRASLRT